jgi:hypothetical protein
MRSNCIASAIFTMNYLLLIIDSLLFAVRPEMPANIQVQDPTNYLIVTQRKTYCGKIIFQDETMIKFRTEELKPIKILKRNIKQISILKKASME